jgi:hypothetical protein
MSRGGRKSWKPQQSSWDDELDELDQQASEQASIAHSIQKG